MLRVAIVIYMFLLGFTIADAGDVLHSHVSKYTESEKQPIKSLSPGDIAELKRGAGWGLAKVAELNGVPGPVHLLEMKHEILLTDSQVKKVTGIYDEMKATAIKQGEHFIMLEQELENSFQSRTITDKKLRTFLAAIADARMKLRYTHLAAHLKTPEILSADQINKYNLLRGYSNSDPCSNIPEGHDPDMWLKHNGCE